MGMGGLLRCLRGEAFYSGRRGNNWQLIVIALVMVPYHSTFPACLSRVDARVFSSEYKTSLEVLLSPANWVSHASSITLHKVWSKCLENRLILFTSEAFLLLSLAGYSMSSSNQLLLIIDHFLLLQSHSFWYCCCKTILSLLERSLVLMFHG